MIIYFSNKVTQRAIAVITSILAQTPTHIDPGQSDESIYLWENPMYIIPIVVIIAVLILLAWIRKKK